VGPRRVLWQPQRVSRRSRHSDGFRDIAGIQQTALPGITGIGTRETVGVQLDRVARSRCKAEERLHVMTPLMGHDDDRGKVADALTMRLQPCGSVVDRFLGSAVEG
jgi:hypothetical protein